jgi:hypothetical protein
MIKVILLTILASGVLGITFPLYNQCDSRWGQDQLGTSSKTICSSGCLVSSAAMALYGVGNTSINPGTLNKWLIDNGGYWYDIFAPFVLVKLGLTIDGIYSNTQIKSLLDQGEILILTVRDGDHYVLATRISGDTVYVNDPGYSVTSYKVSDVTTRGVLAFTPNRLPNFITNFIIDISEFLRFLIGSQEESPFLPAPIPDDDIQKE